MPSHPVRDEPSAPQPVPHHLPYARPLPGTPTYIPITPRPLRMALGLVLLALGMWALLVFLPDHRPTAAVDPLDETKHLLGHVAAIGLAVIGLLLAVSGALYRGQTEVLCRRCHQQVIGWKTSFGLMCPVDKHYAKVSWLVVVTTVGFWVSALGMLATIAIVVLSA